MVVLLNGSSWREIASTATGTAFPVLDRPLIEHVAYTTGDGHALLTAYRLMPMRPATEPIQPADSTQSQRPSESAIEKGPGVVLLKSTVLGIDHAV